MAAQRAKAAPACITHHTHAFNIVGGLQEHGQPHYAIHQATGLAPWLEQRLLVALLTVRLAFSAMQHAFEAVSQRVPVPYSRTIHSL